MGFESLLPSHEPPSPWTVAFLVKTMRTIARPATSDRSRVRGLHGRSTTHETNRSTAVERALLVCVHWRRDGWDPVSSLAELAQLAETAGLQVVGAVTQHLPHPHPRQYVGPGKLAEIAALRRELDFSVVLADDELSPAQLRHLEDALQVKVLDRTALILDIFARRAQTREGRLQVELAQLEYRLPRLTRMWTHLSRQAVGGVGLRGPGETQLEIDRRRARERIAWIRRQLEDVRRHRERYRQRRRQERLPVVSLVGYTNAGKSTLLNALTGASVLVEDKLFATLDPTTRRLALPDGQLALLTDTVGFIHKLPTSLVAAFRATLEEILDAHLLLHVVDVTHPKAAEQAATVRKVLRELGADSYPTITVLNKIDLLTPDVDPEQLAQELGLPPNALLVSAVTGQGLDALRQRIAATLREITTPISVRLRIPYRETNLLALIEERGTIAERRYCANDIIVDAQVPVALLPRLDRYVVPRLRTHETP
ncbi:GTPase HflX [Thermomicrobium sp. CFH 73360]|uniref:GTPase HflX n=1 Tax=Thermomicrobium sp. CFH 73360 TaxID=2951987 RepID=UPI0020779BB1|nr:GTPase HflX [Thermomicrobium sp. CFH 73360]MCM8746748.1 GTPase HflX [Thermomicrobium sp. CFH 73360]